MESLPGQTIPVLILLGSLGILLLVGFMGVFILTYQKKILEEKQKRIVQELEYQELMIQKQLESQEEERKRIAADLHDSVGSLLWGAKVNASMIQRSVGLKEDALAAYTELNQILDESLEIVRRISWELTPEAFNYSGLSESIKKLCSRLDSKGELISFREEGSRFWNDSRALQVFRITQELISNSLKHSGATSIAVVLDWKETGLRMTVSDNGSGFDGKLVQKGVGLWNIRQRIGQLGGQISIGHPPISPGTEVLLDISFGHGKE